MVTAIRRWIRTLAAQPTDAELLAECSKDPWVLGCAVMAHQRTYGMSMGFGCWWSLSGENWVKGPRSAFPQLTVGHMRGFLLRFAEAQGAKDYQEVLREAALRAGVPVPVCINPGETITVELSVGLDQ